MDDATEPTPDLLRKAVAFVKQHLQHHDFDSSHDWWHIERVRKLSVSLVPVLNDEAQAGLKCMVELCAVLHDVADWKYSGCDKAGATTVEAFLTAAQAPPHVTRTVLYVVRNIGFKESLSGAGRPAPPTPAAAAVLNIVQDADRLDALGAIGIARCFTFGGRFNRVMHEPGAQHREGLTKEEYMRSSAGNTTLHHFDEKLLKLEGLMNTAAGKAAAAQRTAFMRAYLDQFHCEWDALDVVVG